MESRKERAVEGYCLVEIRRDIIFLFCCLRIMLGQVGVWFIAFLALNKKGFYLVILVNLGLLEILNQYVGKPPQLCKDNSEGKR